MPNITPIITNGNEKKALELLRTNSAITAKVMAEQMRMSVRKIGRIMKKLKDTGIITRIGSNRKGYWQINK